MEANIILCQCGKYSKMYGMRVQKMEDGDWWRTWAFPTNPERAQREGYTETKVQGNLFATSEYPGCPYCETQNFVQCGGCGKLNCYNGETVLTCGWCGKTLDNIVTATSKFEVSGGKF